MIESDMAYKPLNGVIRWFKAWTAPFVGGVRGYWSDARTLGSQCGAGCLGFLSRADDSFKRLSEQERPSSPSGEIPTHPIAAAWAAREAAEQKVMSSRQRLLEAEEEKEAANAAIEATVKATESGELKGEEMAERIRGLMSQPSIKRIEPEKPHSRRISFSGGFPGLSKRRGSADLRAEKAAAAAAKQAAEEVFSAPAPALPPPNGEVLNA